MHDKELFVAAEGIYTGQFLYCGKKAQLVVGNTLPIGSMPEGSIICNVEAKLGDRGVLAKASGEYCILISHNPDTLSLTPPHTPVTASWIEKAQLPALQEVFDLQVDYSSHTGNKTIDTNGMKRMDAFNDWVFTLSSYDTVICGGHSLWFRSYFRAFLPQDVKAKWKDKKMVNGGAVALTLMRVKDTQGNWRYAIDEKSVEVIYGGF